MFCFNIKKLILSVDSVIVFFIYTIIYSKLVLNLNEFLSSAEHKCYFKESGKPNSPQFVHSNFHSICFPAIKDNVDQQLFGYLRSSNYLILCPALERN